MDKSQSQFLITRSDAAKRYSLCLRSIDNLLADGVLPYVKLSARCIRIPAEAADQALLKYQVGGAK